MQQQSKKQMVIRGRIEGDPYTGHLFIQREPDGKSIELEEFVESNFHDRTVVEIVVTEV